MAQMGFFDLSDRYAKKDSLVEVNAVVQWEGSGQHWSGSGAIFRDALQHETFGSMGISSALQQNRQYIAIGVDRSPKPMFSPSN